MRLIYNKIITPRGSVGTSKGSSIDYSYFALPREPRVEKRLDETFNGIECGGYIFDLHWNVKKKTFSLMVKK